MGVYTWDYSRSSLPRLRSTTAAKVRAEKEKYGLNHGTKVTHKLFPLYGVGIVSTFEYIFGGVIKRVGVHWPQGFHLARHKREESFHAPGLLRPINKSDLKFNFKIHVKTKREE
jgi:hypothetical protein